jgi:RNA polymerase sigma-70 factor (ECF subfamily)
MEVPGYREQRSISAWGQTTPLSLLERVRANDPAAWQRLVELYQPLVRWWCVRSGVPADECEDVAQEVFAAATTSIGGFHRDRAGDTFRGWLRGITRNHVLLYFRRNRNRPQAEGGSDAWRNLQEVPDLANAPDAEEQAQVGQIYRRVLDQVHCEFEERTWQAFWLTAVEGRKPDMLTAELGMTAASIRQAKSRVLRRLKQELGELLD